MNKQLTKSTESSPIIITDIIIIIIIIIIVKSVSIIIQRRVQSEIPASYNGFIRYKLLCSRQHEPNTNETSSFQSDNWLIIGQRLLRHCIRIIAGVRLDSVLLAGEAFVGGRPV